MGISDYYSKDEIVSNSVFEGFTTKFTATHTRGLNHHFYFHHLFGELYSDQDHLWQMFSTQLSYSFLPVIFENSIGINSTGFSLSTKGMWINSTFYSGNTSRTGRKSGFLNSALSLIHLSEINITGKITSELNIEVPVIYYTLRPGYSTLDPDQTIGNGATAFNVARSGKFRSILNQPSFQIGSDFFYSLKENFFLKVGFRYHFLKIQFPKEFSSIDQSFNFGVRWTL